jgi:4-hydroxybenzoate polyprenyltransferase
LGDPPAPTAQGSIAMLHAVSTILPRRLGAYLGVIRPPHWIKNLFVFAPLLFTPATLSLSTLRHAALCFAAFSLAASAIYVFNDIQDRDADRRHPLKRARPIASGLIALPVAWSLIALLLFGAIALSALSGAAVAWVIAVYVATNLLYSLRLKHVPIVDVIIISTGFVMRIAAGAAAVEVTPSPWLLQSTGLIALFLAVAKRRDDVVLNLADDHRGSLSGYNAAFLDMCMGMMLGCLLALYIVYSASAEVIARIGTDRLYYTVPFVVAGIMRYLQITLVERRSGAPTEVVVGDAFLITCMVGWLAVFTALVY